MLKRTRHGLDQVAVEVERLPRDTVAAIEVFLQVRGIDERRLAERLGVSSGKVEQLLSGDENLTLNSLACVAAALDAHFEIKLVPNGGAPAEAEQKCFGLIVCRVASEKVRNAVRFTPRAKQAVACRPSCLFDVGARLASGPAKNMRFQAQLPRGGFNLCCFRMRLRAKTMVDDENMR